jgi:O-antigen/teichoic acid export membrane protein
LRHGLWVVAGRLANIVVAALSTFVVARLLRPTEFGRFTSVFAATQIISLLGVFGLDQAVVMLVGQRSVGRQQGLRRLFRSLIVIVCLTTALSAVVCGAFFAVFGARLTSQEMTAAMVLGAMVFVVIRTYIHTAGEACRAAHDPMAANLLGGQTLGPLSTLIFLTGIAIASRMQDQFDWSQAIWIYSAASVIPAILIGRRLWRAYHNWLPDPPTPDRQDDCRAILSSIAVPFFLCSVLGFCASRVDVILLSFCRPPEEVAIFGAARRLTMLLALPLAITTLTVMTWISRLYAARRIEELGRLVRFGSAVAAAPCLAVCLLFLIWPEQILHYSFGPGYEGAAFILRILVPGQLAYCLSGACGEVLMHCGFTRQSLIITTCSAVLTLVGGTLASIYYGGAGLAAIVSLTLVFDNAAKWFVAGRSTGVWTHPDFRSLLTRAREQFGGKSAQGVDEDETTFDDPSRLLSGSAQ